MQFNKKQKIFLGCLLAINISTANALDFGMFADIRYQNSSEKNKDEEHGDEHKGGNEEAFTLGSVTLHATQKIDEKTTGFIEYTLKAPGSSVVKRLWVRHKISPMLQIGAGQYHSSLGYWNQTYHHGKLTQDTVTRPFFVDLGHEKAIFPSHLTGLKATGFFNLANGVYGSIGYDFTLSNGTTIHSPVSGSNDHSDLHSNSAFDKKRLTILRSSYQSPTLPVQIGLSGMINPIIESSPDGVTELGEGLIDQTVLGWDLKIAMEKFDVTAEYFNIKNKDLVGAAGKNRASAYYIQLGYQLSNKLKSIYRYANLELAKGDTFFLYRGIEEEERHTLALRYEISNTNALTLEAQKHPNATDYYLQWAFMML